MSKEKQDIPADLESKVKETEPIEGIEEETPENGLVMTLKVSLILNKTDLARFFEEYARKVLGSSEYDLADENTDVKYISRLLANLDGDSVRVLKQEAFFSDMELARQRLPWHMRLPYFTQVGDSILGVYGFFPELSTYRHEYRDRGFFVQVGARAYAYAASECAGNPARRDLLQSLSEYFSTYLNKVLDIRRLVDKDKVSNKAIEEARKEKERLMIIN